MSVLNIGGSDSILSVLYDQSLKGSPSPKKRFNETDVDNSGTVNAAELEAMTEDISALTGQTIDPETSISTYDSDSDGELSQSEIDSMMTALMEQFGPASDSSSVDAFFRQAMSSYTDNSGSANIISLIGKLGTLPVPPSQSRPEVTIDGLDTDKDGSYSIEELEGLTNEVAEVSGTSLEADELFSTYDSDKDNLLSEEEMLSLMKDVRETLGPPLHEQYETLADVFSAYLEDADKETLSGLVKVISQYITSTSSSSSGVDVQA
ncbi:MAG: hypothetical protein CSA31_01345 [Desulfobulbus propionicus]|nr:MAG: hypothetical protein CSA31_01345 [Desulfobulbus propionicus]